MNESGTVKRWTSFNDEYHRKKYPSSRHASGLAMDGTGDPDAILKAYREEMKRAGIAEGKDFFLLDDYRNKSKGWTGPHVNFDFRNHEATAAYQVHRAKQMRERGAKPSGAPSGDIRLGDSIFYGGNSADAIKAPPMGAGRTSYNSTNDHRAVHQTNHYAVAFHGVPDPHSHARAFEGPVNRTSLLTLENAQSAIA